jgi:ribosomal protein S18 acetylase RimI-like enzyme
MNKPDDSSESQFREGTTADIATCVSLWVSACAARDGRAVAGVAERARPKFDRAENWIVAEHPSSGMRGFVLATAPGSGVPTDPPGAPVVGLLAVAPGGQGRGLGRALLSASTAELARLGHSQAVLHVLTENHTAVHLYEQSGWQPFGVPFEHTLLKRPMQTYKLDLHQQGIRST